MRKNPVIATVILYFFASSLIAEENVGKALKQVIEEGQKATKAENIDQLLKTVHPQSPIYSRTKRDAVYYERNDFIFTTLSFSYLGRDEEFATARIIQKVTSVGIDHRGKTTQIHELETIKVFRQKDGEWLYWDEVLVDKQRIKSHVEPIE